MRHSDSDQYCQMVDILQYSILLSIPKNISNNILIYVFGVEIYTFLTAHQMDPHHLFNCRATESFGDSQKGQLQISLQSNCMPQARSRALEIQKWPIIKSSIQETVAIISIDFFAANIHELNAESH